ncbi:MAG: hypothetical protein ACFHWZ_07935 [Phycisphaerales bacterium]
MSDYDSSLNSVVWKLMQQTGARQVITTMGDEGLIAFDRIAGAELPEASLIGAVAASIEAGLVGNQAVDARHLLAAAKRTVAAALAVKPVAPTRGRMVV